MAPPTPTPSTRRRQGIRLRDATNEGGQKRRVLSIENLQGIVAIVALAWAVNYLTTWRYDSKKASIASASVNANGLRLPSGVEQIDRKAIAVSASSPIPGFRNATELFATSLEPHFQLFDPTFLNILGAKPELKLVTDVQKREPGFLFAHEAPVWVRDEKSGKDEMWFCSFAGLPPSGWHEGTNVLGKIDLNEVNEKWDTDKELDVAVTKITTSPPLQMTNGGTIYRRSRASPPQVLFVQSGRGTDHAPNLALVSTTSNDKQNEYNATVILDNLFGRQFNSLNDAVVHPKSRAIFVTDPTYGFVVGFRPKPALPVQVYRFDPETGTLHVVADGFHKPNGIAFSPDGRTAYIADSGAASESGFDAMKPATVYAFDVAPDRTTQTFLNRRVFAYVDTTIPDGFALDERGNVYVTSGDGVMVYNPSGTLLGKIFIGTISANIAFADDRLVILAEDKIFVARLGVKGMELDFWR